MHLALTLTEGSRQRDVLVDVGANTTVGDVAQALAVDALFRHPTLSVETPQGSVRLDSAVHVATAIGSGAVVRVTDTSDTEIPSGYSLRVRAGNTPVSVIPLRRGAHRIGRAEYCDIVVPDTTVSALHATLLVGSTIEIVDEHSTNGITLNGLEVPRAIFDVGDCVGLGDVEITLEGGFDRGGDPPQLGPVKFNRSPRLQVSYAGEKFQAPDVPEPARPQRMPYITALLPLVMGGVLFAVTRHAASLLFVLMSPLMAAGSFFQGRITAKADLKDALKNFNDLLSDLVQRIHQEHEHEREMRINENPPLASLTQSLKERSSLIWSRRPDLVGFLSISLGIGTQSSRSEIEYPHRPRGLAAVQRQLRETLEPLHNVEGVPVTCILSEQGPLGIAGPTATRDAIARGIVAQIATMHAPGEVSLAIMCGPARVGDWEWAKWLPHVSHDLHPLPGRALCGSASAIGSAIDELMALVAQRDARDAVRIPAVVVMVEDDAPARRSDLVQLAERGREAGIHLIWLGDSVEHLPASCRTFLDCTNSKVPGVGRVLEGELVSPVALDAIDSATAEQLARLMAPLADANLPSEAAGDIPTTVSFLGELGHDLASDPDDIVRRWEESGSLVTHPSAKRRASSLRAFVGRGTQDAVHLDLKSQGPHALVGGTTGAGKSEFLQAWILGMASAHSPQRVNFLFVDYKGGSAFADCVDLPHSVGLVTDLSPHLVQRALISLKAELRYREHIMNLKAAKDLAELERRGDPDAPPSLVIVVDEFAALVQEVPEFVDGMVSIAQLGRSLGLHLILATQRPAGVIRGNLRANTNLRIALRMADGEDSNDVIGSTLAATFAVDVPGRGSVKSGPGRLSVFQSAYVGGRSLSDRTTSSLTVADFEFGPGKVWTIQQPSPESTEIQADDRTDAARIVQTMRLASTQLDLRDPRRPWLPELSEVYDLHSLIAHTEVTQTLPFAMADLPDSQSQKPVGFKPDIDGALAVFGTGGTGKSTLLRSLACAAGLSEHTGPWQVYGLDFGSRGLAMLEPLPHVGAIIAGDDQERTIRLFRRLRAEIDERAVAFSAQNCSSIAEYRAASGKRDTARILVLIDGFSAMRSAYEVGPETWVLDAVNQLITDGRALGIHVVITADRPTALSGALQSAVQQRLYLRLANDNDIMAAGRAIPRGGFDGVTPPGRGFLAEQEVHIATLGARVDAAGQAAEIAALADSLRAAGAAIAPPVERLPEEIDLMDLPVNAGLRPAIGLQDHDLAPFGIEPKGMFVISGPASSGRRSTVLTILEAMQRHQLPVSAAYFGNSRSHLATAWQWTWSGIDASSAAALAQQLTTALEMNPKAVPVVVLDGVGEMINSPSDMALQELLRACRTSDVFVLAVGETSDLGGSWPLLQMLRSERRGLLLQPESADGETVLRTALPRVNRRDFPAGRGMLVAGGRATRVQIAMPTPSKVRTGLLLPQPNIGD